MSTSCQRSRSGALNETFGDKERRRASVRQCIGSRYDQRAARRAASLGAFHRSVDRTALMPGIGHGLELSCIAADISAGDSSKQTEPSFDDPRSMEAIARSPDDIALPTMEAAVVGHGPEDVPVAVEPEDIALHTMEAALVGHGPEHIPVAVRPEDIALAITLEDIALATTPEHIALTITPEDIALPTMEAAVVGHGPEDVPVAVGPEDIALPTMEAAVVGHGPEDVPVAVEPEDIALHTMEAAVVGHGPEDVPVAVGPEDIALPMMEAAVVGHGSEHLPVAVGPKDIALAITPEDIALATTTEDITLATTPEDIALAITPEDIAYVTSTFVPFANLARRIAGEADWPGTRMPRATYRTADGTLWYARDWWRLYDDAGELAAMRALFERRVLAAAAMLDHRIDPAEEWASYLAGLYGACLRDVTPETIAMKEVLVARIERTLADPRPSDIAWRTRLRASVDMLDGLTKPFAACDRIRFGRPTSRDRLVDEPRRRYPYAFEAACV